MRQFFAAVASLLIALPTLAVETGSVFRDALSSGQQGPEMVALADGSFLLGDSLMRGNDNERPPRLSTIEQPFALGRFEVTFADWQLYAEATGKRMPYNEGWGLSAQRPVINVSWFAAQSYCQWLSKVSGHHYRLPTEAEWEYAARAGRQSYYWWGEQLDSREDHPRAHCRGCGTPRQINGKTSLVGQFAPNAFGLYDTAGNAWEWTASRFSAPYDGSEHNQAGLLDSSPRVTRGGGWNSGPVYLRSSLRDMKQPHISDYAQGLRVLRELP
jgi:formylglycine-generating enzyme required for sulfatase activity